MKAFRCLKFASFFLNNKGNVTIRRIMSDAHEKSRLQFHSCAINDRLFNLYPLGLSQMPYVTWGKPYDSFGRLK